MLCIMCPCLPFGLTNAHITIFTSGNTIPFQGKIIDYLQTGAYELEDTMQIF